MFTADQYRAKASEYAKLVGLASGSNEVREFQRLERSFAQLADNAQWVSDNHGKIVPAAEHAAAPLAPDDTARNSSSQQ